MAKYIGVGSNGIETEIQALTASSGVGDANKIIQTDATGFIDQTLLPPGFGDEVLTLPASETLAAGDLVNFWDDAGTLKMRKADASAANAGKKADGFVKTAITSGATGSVYTGQGDVLTGLTGLTLGATYFLSNSTAGAVTATPVVTAGHILQVVGRAIAATQIVFDPSRPIVRA